MPVNYMNARAKLYLDPAAPTDAFNYSVSSRDISYPAELDVKNRRGKNWHVLSVDLDSPFGLKALRSSDEASTLVHHQTSNPFRGKYASASTTNITKWTVNLADLYFYLYDSLDFRVEYLNGDTVIRTLDSVEPYKRVVEYTGNEEDIFKESYYTNSHFNAFDIDLDEYQYMGDPESLAKKDIAVIDIVEYSLPAVTGTSEVRFYLKDTNVLFYTKYVISVIGKIEVSSLSMMDVHPIIPFTLTDSHGREIDYISLTYQKMAPGYTWSYNPVDMQRTMFTFKDDSFRGFVMNALEIEFLKRDAILESCVSIDFLLGAGMTITERDLTYKNGVLAGRNAMFSEFESMNKFYRVGLNEFPLDEEDIAYDGDEKTMKIAGSFKFGYDKGYTAELSRNSFKYADAVRVNLVMKDARDSNGVYESPISVCFIPFRSHTFESSITIDNNVVKTEPSVVTIPKSSLSVITAGSNQLIISKTLLNTDDGERLYDVEQKLTSAELVDSNGNAVMVLDASNFRWAIKNLELTFSVSSVPDYAAIRLTFEKRYVVIDKSSLVDSDDTFVHLVVDDAVISSLIESGEYESVSASLVEQGKSLFNPHLYMLSGGEEVGGLAYVHDELSTSIYVNDGFANGEYGVKLIDFGSIYSFATTTLNYFDKAISACIVSVKSSDGIDDSFNGVSFVIAEPYTIGTRLDNEERLNPASSFTFTPDYTGGMPALTGYVSKLPECRTYAAAGHALYSYGNFRDLIDISLSASTSGDTSKFYVDGSVSSVVSLSGSSPLIHMYGWFTDSLGNKILETPGMISDSVLSAASSPNVQEFLNGRQVPYSWQKSLYSYDMTRTAKTPIVAYYYGDANRLRCVDKGHNRLNSALEKESAWTYLKGNDTPFTLKLTNNDPNLSADLQYFFRQNKVYKYRSPYGDEIISNSYPLSAKPDEWIDVDSYELIASGYSRSEYSNVEYNNKYDFLFASVSDLDESGTLRRRGRDSIYPGDYTAEMLIGDAVVSTWQLSCSASSQTSMLGVEMEWPTVNVIGKIVDSSTGDVIHKDGMTVRMIDNDTNEVHDFTYRCARPMQEGLFGLKIVGRDISEMIEPDPYMPEPEPYDSYTTPGKFSEDTNSFVKLLSGMYADMGGDATIATASTSSYWVNAWDETFRFAYNGCDCSPLMMLKSVGSDSAEYVNMDSLRSAPGLKPGSYTMQLVYEDTVLTTYYNDFTVSKENQANLYSLRLDFPYCRVSGTIRDSSGVVQCGDSWTVTLSSVSEGGTTRTMHLYDRDRGSNNTVSSYVFNGLGQPRYVYERGDFSSRRGKPIYINGYYSMDAAAVEDGSTTQYDWAYSNSDCSYVSTYDVNTFGYLGSYQEPGVKPGDYVVIVKEDGVERYRSDVKHITKYGEGQNGYVFDIELARNKTELSGTIVVDQFGGFTPSEHSGTIKIVKASPDKDISDPTNFTNPSNTMTCNGISSFVFNEVANDTAFSISMSETVNGSQYELSIADVVFKTGDPGDGSTMFNQKGTLNPSHDVMRMDYTNPKQDTTVVEVHLSSWNTLFGKAFVYMDEHMTEDNFYPATPVFETNTSFDGVTWQNTNIVFGSEYDYTTSYWYIVRSVVATGPHALSMTKRNPVAGVSALYESVANVMTQDVSVVRSSLNLATLNFVPVFYNESKGAYDIVTSVRFGVGYRNGSNEFVKWADRQDIDDAPPPDMDYIDLGDADYLNKSFSVSLKYTDGSMVTTYSLPVQQKRLYIQQLPIVDDVIELTCKAAGTSTYSAASVSSYQYEFGGLYKLGVGRSIDSSQDYIPAVSDPGMIDVIESELRASAPRVDSLQGVSIENLVKEYILPVKSQHPEMSSYSDAALMKALTHKYESSLGLVCKFGDIDSLTGEANAILDFAATPFDQLTDDAAGYTEFDQIQTTSSVEDFIGEPLLQAFSTNGYVSGKLQLSTLGLKNPNELPIRYYPLVIKSMEIDAKLVLKIRDKSGAVKHLNPWHVNNLLHLKLEDGTAYYPILLTRQENEHECMTVFELNKVKTGWHDIDVYDEVSEAPSSKIASGRIYLWQHNGSADFIIDDPYVDCVPSGVVNYNGSGSANSVHVKVFAGAETANTVAGALSNPMYRYGFGGKHGGQNEYSYEDGKMMSRNEFASTTVDGATYPFVSGSFDGRRCFMNDISRSPSKYRLYDIKPGVYTLEYYVMPTINESTSEWEHFGDSYFYFDTYDYEENQDGSLTFNVPVSSIQNRKKSVTASLVQDVLRDDVAAKSDWKIMEVLEFRTMAYNKKKSPISTEKALGSIMNTTAVPFRCSRDGDVFHVTCYPEAIQFKEMRANEVNRMWIRVLFGELAAYQTVTIDDTTTTLPPVNLSVSYARRTTFSGKNYIKNPVSMNWINHNKTYGEFAATANGQEIQRKTLTFTESKEASGDTTFTVVYFGLETGTQLSANWDLAIPGKLTHMADATSTVSTAIQTISLAAPTLNVADLTFIDRALEMAVASGYASIDTSIKNNAVACFVYLTDSQLQSPFISGYSNTDTSKLSLSGLLDGDYSIGSYVLRNNDGGEFINSGADRDYDEYKFFTFNKTSFTSGVFSETIASNVARTVSIPYQRCNLHVDFFNLKEQSSCSETEFMTNDDTSQVMHNLTRTIERQSFDGYDGAIADLPSETSMHKSGIYRISYQSIRLDQPDNPYLVTYDNFIMDDNKSLTLYKHLSLVSVTVKLYIDGNQTSGKIHLYDSNRNLYKTMEASSTGELMMSVFTMPMFVQPVGFDFEFISVEPPKWNSSTESFEVVPFTFQPDKTYVIDAWTSTKTATISIL